MIRIEVLGGLRVSRDALPLDSLLTQRLRSCVLVYLALERDVSREALLRVFWPDREPEKARHLLSQMLYELRGDLGDAWIQVHGERLGATDQLSSDALEFERLAAADCVTEALALYHGPLLANAQLPESAGCEQWADGRRAHYARLYRKLVRSAIASAVSANDFVRASNIALTAAEAEPLEDEFHHAAIDLLARSGQRAEALRHFEAYETVLREAQLTPLDETLALVQAIREGKAEAAPLDVQPVRLRTKTAAEESDATSGATAGVGAESFLHRHRFGFAALAVFLGVSAVPAIHSIITADRPFMTDADLRPDRVAVLPFEVAGSGGAGVSADALHAGIVADLGRSPLLDVVPKSIVQREAPLAQQNADLAHALKALLLVTGSISTDSVVRLTVHVRDGATDLQLATRTFEQHSSPDAGRLLQRRAVDYLSGQLSRTLVFLRHRRDARNRKAWDLFEDALRRFYNATGLAEVDDKAAIQALVSADSLLKNAEESDRHWIAPTLLRSELAIRAANLLRPDSGTDTWYRAALSHAQRAVQEHRESMDALEMRGIAAYELWRWRGQKERVDAAELRRAAEADLAGVVAADNKRSRALIALAHIHEIRGRYREESKLAQLALQVDPTSSRETGLFYRLAIVSLELGREDEAIDWCRRGRERYPEDIRLQYCELAVLAYGDSLPPDPARAWQVTGQLKRTMPQQPVLVPMFEMLTAAVLARAGLADSARAVAARASAAAPGSVSLMSPEAAMWTRLGDYNRAVQILEADASKDPVGMRSTLLKQVFVPLRPHPGFRRMYNRFVVESP